MTRFLIIAAALGLAPAVARAQTGPFERDIDLVVVKPTPAFNSGIGLEGATTRAAFDYRLELALDFNDGLLALVGAGGRKLGDLIPYRFDAHLMGAFQILPRLDVGVDVPITWAQGNGFAIFDTFGIPQPGIMAFGFGDVRLVPRFVLLSQSKAARMPLGLAVVGEVRFPTGDGQSFLGEHGFLFAPRVALERAFGPLRLLLNLGVRIRSPSQYLNLVVGNELTLGAGVIYSLPSFWKLKHVEAVGEMHLGTQLNAPFTFTRAQSFKTPWEVLVGARVRWTERWGVELDVGRGVTGNSGYGREAFRVIAALRYDFDAPQPARRNLDSDGDGVPDSEDACPHVPGPREYDGCPDSDNDEVPDNVDKCPNEPGPAENDGCPVGNPLVVLERNRIRLRQSVLFETGKAVIQKQSYPVLDAAAKLLSEHPELGRMRVDGHTDNTGAPSFNQDLSERRAKAVVDYLAKRDVARERLSARGFGMDRPITSNATAIGRARNRRVEFTPLDAKNGQLETAKIVPAPPAPPPSVKLAPNTEPAMRPARNPAPASERRAP